MSFKVGDKVTHPLTGDAVWTVLTDFTRLDGTLRCHDSARLHQFDAPTSEFTPYTPPRVSTQELANRVYRAYNSLLDATEANAMCAQALAEAATAYAERLEEETK